MRQISTPVPLALEKWAWMSCGQETEEAGRIASGLARGIRAFRTFLLVLRSVKEPLGSPVRARGIGEAARVVILLESYGQL